MLYDRFLEGRKHLELLLGYNTAAVINSSFSPPEEAVAPARFMPSLFTEPVEPSEEEVAVDLGAAFRGLMQRGHTAPAPPKRKRRKKS